MCEREMYSNMMVLGFSAVSEFPLRNQRVVQMVEFQLCGDVLVFWNPYVRTFVPENCIFIAVFFEIEFDRRTDGLPRSDDRIVDRDESTDTRSERLTFVSWNDN